MKTSKPPHFTTYGQGPNCELFLRNCGVLRDFGDCGTAWRRSWKLNDTCKAGISALTCPMAVRSPPMGFEAGPRLAVAHVAIQPRLDQCLHLRSILASFVISPFKEDEPEGVLTRVEG